MTDDELLASAFRKILKPGRYSYLHVAGDDELPHVTLDDTWTVHDGLTVEEVAAIRRAAS